jgi:hypothetical protein
MSKMTQDLSTGHLGSLYYQAHHKIRFNGNEDSFYQNFVLQSRDTYIEAYNQLLQNITDVAVGKKKLEDFPTYEQIKETNKHYCAPKSTPDVSLIGFPEFRERFKKYFCYTASKKGMKIEIMIETFSEAKNPITYSDRMNEKKIVKITIPTKHARAGNFPTKKLANFLQ